MPEDLDTNKLQKEIKVLKRKLQRSETNRVNLEKMWDRNSHLFETLNAEIAQQRNVIAERLLGLPKDP